VLGCPQQPEPHERIRPAYRTAIDGFSRKPLVEAGDDFDRQIA